MEGEYSTVDVTTWAELERHCLIWFHDWNSWTKLERSHFKVSFEGMQDLAGARKQIFYTIAWWKGEAISRQSNAITKPAPINSVYLHEFFRIVFEPSGKATVTVSLKAESFDILKIYSTRLTSRRDGVSKSRITRRKGPQRHPRTSIPTVKIISRELALTVLALVTTCYEGALDDLSILSFPGTDEEYF